MEAWSRKKVKVRLPPAVAMAGSLLGVVGVLVSTEYIFHAVGHAIAVEVITGGAGWGVGGGP